MTEREIIKKINTTNWYRQGGAIVPYYPSMAYRALFDYFGGFNYFREGVNYGYIESERERKMCNHLIAGVLKQKNYCLYRLIRPWRKRRDKVYLFSERITPHYLVIGEKHSRQVHKSLDFSSRSEAKIMI